MVLLVETVLVVGKPNYFASTVLWLRTGNTKKNLDRITLFLLFHYTTVTFGMDPTISEAVAHSRIISAEPSSSCIFAWYEIQLHSGPGSYQIPASLKCFMCKISIVPLCQLLVKWKLLRNLQNPTCMNHLIFNIVCHLCVISNHTLS